MFGDKQYAKQPYKYPTPAEIPEDTGCRTFQIPSDPAWFALFMGALYPLTLPDSFQQNEGGLSVETTAEIFQDLIELTYANAENGCVFCTQPGGEPIVRLDEDGYFQQLVDSEWLPPEGEYEIPPTPEREEPTDDEKRCAAAANATNVMKVLYETLADDYAEGLTLAEAIAHFIAVVAALILLPGGLIAAAIALALVVFRIMFETAEFVTADYWTTGFDEKFQCALYECSSVDGSGVVTFDYVCFQDNLARRIDAVGDPFEVVLWGQVQAMLMFLGVDGLNLAGATTAITSADCSDCETCENYNDDMTLELGELTHLVPYNGIKSLRNTDNRAGYWQSTGGNGGGGCIIGEIVGTFSGGVRRQAVVVVDLGKECDVTAASMWTLENSNGQSRARAISYYDASLTVLRDAVSSAPTTTSWEIFWDGAAVSGCRYIRFGMEVNNANTTAIYLDDIDVNVSP